MRRMLIDKVSVQFFFQLLIKLIQQIPQQKVQHILEMLTMDYTLPFCLSQLIKIVKYT